MREQPSTRVTLHQKRLHQIVVMLLATALSILPGGSVSGQRQTDTTLRYKQVVRTEMEGTPLPVPPMETTFWIRGPRQRSESPRQPLVTITQCDLQRIIYVNPQNQTCLIQPLDGAGGYRSAEIPVPPEPAKSPRKGGTITLTGEIKDTGETKMIFGRRARRIIVHQVVEGSPDSCSPGRMEITLDMWMTNLPEWRCEVKQSQPHYLPSTVLSRPDCLDQIRVNMKSTDAAITQHFPLFSTMTMTVEGRRMSVISEVTEMSSDPPDAALFEMPPDCRLVTDATAFWAGVRPDKISLSDALKGAGSVIESGRARAATVEPKRPGILRIGVSLTNTSGSSLDVSSLRNEMVSTIESKGEGKLDAVELVASGNEALQAEAEAKGVDYILAVNLREAKQDTGRTLGGLIGRRIGVGVGDKTMMKLDYQWIAPKTMEALTTRSLGQEVKGQPPDAAQHFCRMSAENALSDLWRAIRK